MFVFYFKKSTTVGEMINKLDYHAFTSEFECQWVLHSYGLVPHLDKKLSKLQVILDAAV